MELELKEGTSVFTADDKQVGKINRFVLDPAKNEVTHIVVQKGWLLPEDKVVPIDWVASASEDKVMLKEDIGDFEQLPPFEETHFLQANRVEDEEAAPAYLYAPAYYWYPPAGFMGYAGYGLGYYDWPPVENKRNIPEDTVPLREGAEVITSDDKHVGTVEEIFLNPDSNRATHFLISHGLLFKEQRLIPAHWVERVEEDKVHLSVGSHLLEHLTPYPVV